MLTKIGDLQIGTPLATSLLGRKPVTDCMAFLAGQEFKYLHSEEE
jgi:hypothetical protein